MHDCPLESFGRPIASRLLVEETVARLEILADIERGIILRRTTHVDLDQRTAA